MVAKNQGVKAYLAISVTLSPGGTISIRRLRLDQSSRRVIPELLDEFPDQGKLSLEEVLRHWAQEAVLDSWDVPL